MKQLILQDFVTVDGFAAGPQGDMNFLGTFAGRTRDDLERDAVRFMEGIDLILMGAVTYQMFSGYWPAATKEMDPIAPAINTTPKIVFSDSLARAPWGDWQEAKVVNGDAAAEVERLKQLPGKNIVLWGSISLAHSLMRAGLIDEYQFRVCPVAIGTGRGVFAEDMNVDLDLVETRPYESGLVLLRYQPRQRSA